ncbi:RND transporter [Methylomonas lenta]|uniref:RND transporter n=1 Tax=Methylomonas lenta TaxID=980561 RepID=A0A177MX75_9GAMM|nr:efflux transporter outer membrane subunit [Methylomonas lenta]OAI10318.1 RND transporter [Methylomonas lenta]
MNNVEQLQRAGTDRIVVRTYTALVVTGLLAGCTVGPDFKPPAAPDIAGYTATPLVTQTAAAATALGDAQHFSSGAKVSAQWWHELGSPKLDALIEQAMQASPTLASARATLQQAQEIYVAQEGAMTYPQIDAGFSAQPQRFNPIVLGQDGGAREFSLFIAGVNVQYQLDLAGGNRRTLEALAAQTDYHHHVLAGAQLTLAGNIVTTAVTQARLAAQIQSTEAILRDQDEQLHLTKERVRLGQAAPDEVLALQTQVEQTRAGLPVLRKQSQQNAHLLAVLSGHAPGEGRLPTFTLEEFSLPSDLPLLVPSDLVRHRPDIQGAEALLHAANAEYGSAIAKLYPQLNLSGNLATQTLIAGALFGPGSAIWNVLGQLTQPLFNPALPAEKRAALAAFDAAAANYQSVVLESLRNVADVLRALENDAQTLTALAAADAAAQGFLQSVQRQYALGAASYVQQLIAQQAAQQTSINLIAAQAQRLVDSAALYQAMGGGVS